MSHKRHLKQSKTTEEINQHSDKLRSWFIQLTAEERGRVLSFEDKDGNQLLRQMYKTLQSEGKGLFYSVGDPEIAFLDKEKRFCFMTLASFMNSCFYPEKLLEFDKKLEDSIRLCDTREYLDTITVASNLLENGTQFLKLMNIVTRGNFLSSPCKVYWDPSIRSWIWEEPKWFQGMGFYTLATWVAHKIEKALWMRYFDHHKLDPRRKPTLLNYTFPNYLEGLLSKTYLISFWKTRNPQERRKIVGNLGDVVRHVILNTDENSSRSTINTKLTKASKFSDYQGLLESLVDLSDQERNLEALFTDSDLSQNEKTFIEILYFSPLSRAGATIDMILRRVGMSIHGAYTEKISMDLIIGEETDKIKAAAHNEAKKKRKKKKKLKVKEKKKEQAEREREEREQKEREEKERKEKERQLQEQIRLRKAMSSLVMEVVVQAEAVIDKKKKSSQPEPKKKTKPKKKKKPRAKSDTITGASIGKAPSYGESQAKDLFITLSDQNLRTESLLISQRREELISKLHLEVEDFVMQTKRIIETNYNPRASSMITKIKSIVMDIWRNGDVKPYGSFLTSLVLPSSDLDLVIIGTNSSYVTQDLRVLANHLANQGWAQSIQVIETAKVPIIKLMSKTEQLPTDIAIEELKTDAPMYCCSEGLARHSGIAAAELVRSYVRKMPPLAPLVLLLKQFLCERQLNSSFTGGLSSYCITLMTISYLQLTDYERQIKRGNLGKLLLGFLDLYGRKFNYESTGITITGGGSHFPLEHLGVRTFPPAPIVLVDPFNPTHNIAPNVAIDKVKHAFEESYNYLSQTIDIGYNSTGTILSKFVSLPTTVLINPDTQNTSPSVQWKPGMTHLYRTTPNSNLNPQYCTYPPRPPRSTLR